MEEDEENQGVVMADKSPETLNGCDSERLMKGTRKCPDIPDTIRDHERSCVRRSEVVKHRGISLLNEVDAQYSALQVKYDELLRRCHQGEEGEELQSHKAVQTPSVCPAAFALSQAMGTDMEAFQDDFHQPEYKALFKEIFTCLRKTKEDLSENRGKSSSGGGMHLLH